MSTTWPVSLPDVAKDVNRDATPDSMSVYHLRNEMADRLARESRKGPGRAELSLSALNDPIYLRSYADTPRGKGEAELRAEWMGDYFAIRLQGQAVRDAADDRDYRLDGSYGGIVLGNWSLTAGSIPRWWGPGWNGSLILSNNARPVPAIALDRNYTDAIDLPVLRWLGEWDLSAFMGQLEDDREVSGPKLLGMRLALQPVSFLEIGMSRTAMWGGEDRPEDFTSMRDILLGKSNQNEASGEEPGNQLTGFDFRLASPWRSFPVALYGQAIGEDEAGGMPYKWMSLAGVETWGIMPVLSGTFRIYAEVAETTLFYRDAPDNVQFNTAYEHHVYPDGYRYYGRSLGHPADSDTTLATLGAVLAHSSGVTWHGMLRRGDINRDGSGGNPLAPQGTDLYGGYVSIEVPTSYGTLEAGSEVHRLDPDPENGEAETNYNAFLRLSWQLL